MEYARSGCPASSLVFLPGILWLPALAGMIAIVSLMTQAPKKVDTTLMSEYWSME